MGGVKVETQDRVLTDAVLESPTDKRQLRARRLVIGTALAVVFGSVGGLALKLTRDVPVEYDDPVEHFKYGSIGSEPGGSLMNAVGGLLPPTKVFKILPDLCADRLPGGYPSLGLVFEKGHDLPIGMSERMRLGVDQVGVNCAVCHSSTYRATPTDERHIVLGMPANRLKLQLVFRFVLDCVMDERFTADNVVGLIDEKVGGLGPLDRLMYRTQVVPRVREQVVEMNARVGILMGDKVTPWGPGRVDTFNPYKAMQFHWNLEQLSRDEIIGASDYPSLWNQKPREGLHLHWDGNNDSLAERNLSAALGAGVTPVTADYAAINRVRDWISTLPAPKYPFPIDAAKAAKGAPIYGKYCAECHGDNKFRDGVVSGKWLGQVTPLAEIGTDPYRFRSYTFEFSENQYTLYPSTEHRFTHFRKTDGYANHPLDGIWLRAPYLHNGAVPTMRDLLDPPASRPKKFYRGYDVYDPVKLGFVSNVAVDGDQPVDVYDTSLPGNANSGHTYGTDLPDDDKDAIVEYMKTF